MRGERIRAQRFTVAFLAVATGLAAASPASAATTLTTGTLTDAAGAPTTGQVRVYAWPHSDQAMTLPLLGTAQAAPDGTFAVMAADEAQLAELSHQRDGWLDFTAVADMPGHQGEWSFTGFVDTQAGQVRVATPAAVATRAGVARVSTAGTSAPSIRIRANRLASVSGRSAQRGRCRDERQVRNPESVRKLALVGELNNAYNDNSWGRFTYGQERTAETNFGVAMSTDSGGNWSINGENAIRDRGSVRFPTAQRRYARKLQSQFEFTHQAARNNTCAAWDEVIRATSWIGGTDDSIRQRGALDQCDPVHLQGFEAGAGFHRDSSAATRWRRGVEAFGVYLTTQSGFSRNVALDYGFKGGAGKYHYLCGPDGKQSPYAAGRVFSGSRK